MKIKTGKMRYEEVLRQPGFVHEKPVRPSMFFRWLLKTLSEGELKKVKFFVETRGAELPGEEQPCMFLMNHSSFIDLKIASSILYPRPFNIVCTYDGFVGKEGIMRRIGCIPTHKFMSDVTLVKDLVYALRDLKSSVLMFPEASYSFDGTATPLPESLGKCLKLLKVPVVMIRTEGAFARDPLYNNLQLRDTEVSARMEVLLMPDQIREKSVEEINRILKKAFDYDHFRWQQEKGVRITESFRADHLERVLYKCPVCWAEGKMLGKGTRLICAHCGHAWELTEDGWMQDETDPGKLRHIPDWYAWQREEVRKELDDGSYRMEIPVQIRMLVNTKKVFEVGEGKLIHDTEGFHLTGCEGALSYDQKPQLSYSLYADYYWYELGDMICIGTEKAQYYCFPKKEGTPVAKARLAAEELYRMTRKSQKKIEAAVKKEWKKTVNPYILVEQLSND